MTRQQLTCRGIFFGLILAQSVLAGCGGAGEERPGAQYELVADADAVKDSIQMVLNKQVEAWNQGNIRGFMEGYQEADSLRFASGGDVWYGWDRTFQRYQETYIDEGMMGTLSFEEVEIRPLSSKHALVFGRWGLARSEEHTNIGGLFTLLFQKRPEGWRIIHDHTSSPSPGASDSLIVTENHGQSVE